MSTDTTIESLAISALQKAVANCIVKAFSDDSGPEEMDTGTLGGGVIATLNFTSYEVDRDFAYSPSTVVALLKEDEDDAEGADEVPALEVKMWSHHAEPGDDWTYTTHYLVQPGNVLLSLSGSPGEYSDDDHDLYLSGSIEFHPDQTALEERALHLQHASVDSTIGYALSMIETALRELPVGERPSAANRVCERSVEMRRSTEPACSVPSEAHEAQPMTVEA